MIFSPGVNVAVEAAAKLIVAIDATKLATIIIDMRLIIQPLLASNPTTCGHCAQGCT
jgi:hypothetical protein